MRIYAPHIAHLAHNEDYATRGRLCPKVFKIQLGRTLLLHVSAPGKYCYEA